MPPGPSTSSPPFSPAACRLLRLLRLLLCLLLCVLRLMHRACSDVVPQ